MGLFVSWFFGRREVRGESERRRGWGWRSFAPLGALTLWGVADAPRAEGLDMATLGVMLEEEIVRVEAVMGRQVLETPTLRAATFEEFVSTSMVAKRLRDPRLAADPKAFTAAERALREEHANTIAVYTNYDGAITLLTDRLSETVKELGDTSAIAALRCVMDHEVAHAQVAHERVVKHLAERVEAPGVDQLDVGQGEATGLGGCIAHGLPRGGAGNAAAAMAAKETMTASWRGPWCPGVGSSLSMTPTTHPYAQMGTASSERAGVRSGR